MKKYLGLAVLLLILVGLTVKVIASEITFSDISIDSFDKQQICIHHDSFLKESDSLKWHIGGNADEPRRPLDYYSPRLDHDTIDVGFYIESGQLKSKIKESYKKNHNPYLSVYVDGRTVYTSCEPNCYNTPWGGYIRYGIYKAEWLSGCAQIGERCLYVDNMKIQM